MNHVNVLIVVQQHLHKIHVGVKMVVVLIYVINVVFIHLVHIKFQQIRLCIQQGRIQMIELFERVYEFNKFIFNIIIYFRELFIVQAINVQIVVQLIQLYGDEMQVEKVFVMLVVFIINYME
jgi:hypothetical protein